MGLLPLSLFRDFLALIKSISRRRNTRHDGKAEDASTLSGDFLSELQFWDLELSLKGLYADWMRYRTDPRQQGKGYPWDVQPLIDDLRSRNSQIPKVLDVGSGPISLLVYAAQQSWIDLISVDPLAEEYEELLKKHKCQQYQKLIKGFGENLTNLFGYNVFDMVFMYNALDHSQDPQVVFKKLVDVLRPGGYLVIQGQSREGTAAAWEGLHHHDLYVAPGGKLMCDSKKNKCDSGVIINYLSEGFPLQLIEASEPTDEVHKWVRIVWRKLNNLEV